MTDPKIKSSLAIRPEQLARELGVQGIKVRNYLRAHYPRPREESHAPWLLTDKQAAAVRMAFASRLSPASRVTHGTRTDRQRLGTLGEEAVRTIVPCPRCRRERHLVGLPTNFQCADLICKFCGFLAQVKSATLKDGRLPNRILGAAWAPQHDQILSGIYQPLFIVGFDADSRLISIDYVPAHILQASPAVFEPRAPLKLTAKRAGWTGFNYRLTELPPIGIKRVYERAAR